MQFNKVNFWSANILVAFAVSGIGSLALVIMWIITEEAIYLGLFIFLLLSLAFFYALGFVTKIIFSNSFVSYNDPRKKIVMLWKDIKSAGVYRIERGVIYKVDEKDFDKFLLGQKFIYLSTIESFFPWAGKKVDNTYIHFHWRREVWTEVQKLMAV